MQFRVQLMVEYLRRYAVWYGGSLLASLVSVKSPLLPPCQLICIFSARILHFLPHQSPVRRDRAKHLQTLSDIREYDVNYISNPVFLCLKKRYFRWNLWKDLGQSVSYVKGTLTSLCDLAFAFTLQQWPQPSTPYRPYLWLPRPSCSPIT